LFLSVFDRTEGNRKIGCDSSFVKNIVIGYFQKGIGSGIFSKIGNKKMFNAIYVFVFVLVLLFLFFCPGMLEKDDPMGMFVRPV